MTELNNQQQEKDVANNLSKNYFNNISSNDMFETVQSKPLNVNAIEQLLMNNFVDRFKSLFMVMGSLVNNQ